jgi:hypothetical protein
VAGAVEEVEMEVLVHLRGVVHAVGDAARPVVRAPAARGPLSVCRQTTRPLRVSRVRVLSAEATAT